MIKKALIIVDYQYDFVASDGKLTAGVAAARIEKNIAHLASQYEEEDIYFTLDAHTEDDWARPDIYKETGAFPFHCIKGTKGYEIYGDIKGKDNTNHHIEKNAYCPGHHFLMKMAEGYDEITVVGVVTDICVFQTVVGLYTVSTNSGIPLQLTVDSACVASFNEAREQLMLAYMKDILGVTIL